MLHQTTISELSIHIELIKLFTQLINLIAPIASIFITVITILISIIAILLSLSVIFKLATVCPAMDMMEWDPATPPVAAPSLKRSMPGSFPISPANVFARRQEEPAVAAESDESFFNTGKRVCLGLVSVPSMSLIAIVRRVRQYQFRPTRPTRQITTRRPPVSPRIALVLFSEPIVVRHHVTAPKTINNVLPTAKKSAVEILAPYTVLNPTAGASTTSPIPLAKSASPSTRPSAELGVTSKRISNWKKHYPIKGPSKIIIEKTQELVEIPAIKAGIKVEPSRPETPKDETPKSNQFGGRTTTRSAHFKALEEAAKANQQSLYDIKPLSKELNAKVDDALRNGHGNYTSRDFQKVVPISGKDGGTDSWLSDETINGYLGVVTKHGNRNVKAGDSPRFHAFSTFFYTTIDSKGYKGVERWAKKAKIEGKKLLNLEKIFIPVNPSNHWTLAVVEPKIKRITHYNSLGGGGSTSQTYIGKIMEWLRGELGTHFVEKDWEQVLKGKSSQQTNFSDCGVFTVTTAKMIMLGKDTTAYDTRDIPNQRRRMIAELVKGELVKNLWARNEE